MAPLTDSEPAVKPVERVVAVDDASAAGGVAGELQRRLDGLGAAVAEVDPVEVRRRGEQPLGQQAGQRRRVELGQVGQIGVEDVVQAWRTTGWWRPSANTPKPASMSRYSRPSAS